MIFVCKPHAPMKLRNEGVRRTREDCETYNANRNDYICGVRKFRFDQKIYGHKTVRDVLKRAQHKKCCFCEGKFSAHASGDVEHYRPKGAVQQDEDSEKLTPGYFWLAYSWNNLFWCCQICNRSHKKNLFPLDDPTKRARSHIDNVDAETPLILNPGGSEDPRKHIGFRQELAIGLTEAGRKTIQTVGLNRSELIEERLKRLRELDSLLKIVQISDSDPNFRITHLLGETRRKLEAAVLPEAVFSAMAFALLNDTSAL